ncbi:MAG: ABC transporter ATP-binding protein [Nitrospinae bacterium]|nr:ABC transporter ATP-binding protein [Nitrospinota bacterium]
MSEKPIIMVKGLSKSYNLNNERIPALRNVSLEVKQGEFIAIAGPSGSGKSTLLHLLGGIDTPDTGQILVNLKDLTVMSEKNRAIYRRFDVGFIFQSFSLIPVLSAFENVEYSLLLKKLKEGEREVMVREALKSVGLEGLESRRPNQMSGGQQQRVAVARAMVGNPAFILADEPTANLDTRTGIDLIDLMKRVNERQGVTFIFSTHDPKIISRAGRVYYLEDGSLKDKTV